MITAIRKAHAEKGPWVTEGGYEYPLALIAASLTLAETGPGRPSVDCSLMPRFKGSGYALLVLAAAAAGSYLVTEKFNEARPRSPQRRRATRRRASRAAAPVLARSGRDVRDDRLTAARAVRLAAPWNAG